MKRTIEILYQELKRLENEIGLLDGQKLLLMAEVEKLLDELETLGEKVSL